MPDTSAACGFSPTARTSSPQRVRYTSHHGERDERVDEVGRPRAGEQRLADERDVGEAAGSRTTTAVVAAELDLGVEERGEADAPAR